MARTREQIKDRAWELLEPELDAYSRFIDVLMDAMAIQDLRKVINNMESDLK